VGVAVRRAKARHWVSTMHALRNAPTARAFRHRDHSRRVADLAEAVANAMELPDPEVATIRLAALLHDVGNVGISDDILLKPGPLTEAEFSHVREHVDRGARDFRAVGALQGAVPIVRHHHEHVDGTGYPEGLRGQEIPLGARVVAAADAYVMMTADVPWRAAKSHEDAISELQDSAGLHLDEEVVARLISVLRSRNNGVK
jgi:putative nucleotidyltransferase with HDIG domain